MPVSFKGAKPSPSAVKPAAKTAYAPKPLSTSGGPTAPAKKPALSFVKRGAEAAKIQEMRDKQAEARKAEVQRFWIPDGAETQITFLDGNLLDGMLDIPFLHEHQVHMNGHFRNWFICTQDEEPCPICEGGGSKLDYVGFMTVIDHSEFKDKSGKTRKDELRLFVAKRDTIKLLQKQAVKRGGLRGCRFEVSRVGDKSPSVGSSFEFVEKVSDTQLKALYKDHSNPVDYDTYFAAIYLPASELRARGFGSMSAPPVGSEPAPNYEM